MISNLVLNLPLSVTWWQKTVNKQLTISTEELFGVKKNKFIFNMNAWRNQHHHQKNVTKILFRNLIGEQLEGSGLRECDDIFQVDAELKIDLFYWHPNKRRIDLSNPCGILDKYLCDALTFHGMIEDDNTDIIKRVTYHWCGVKPKKGQCIAVISGMESDHQKQYRADRLDELRQDILKDYLDIAGMLDEEV